MQQCVRAGQQPDHRRSTIKDLCRSIVCSSERTGRRHGLWCSLRGGASASAGVEDLGQELPANETEAALDSFRDQANVLVDFMLATATKSASQHELLSETLDGISFAMSHDVKRIFESELKAPNWKTGEQLSIGKVAYIRGLLTNCLQQSLITLAQVFDPSLDGARLFDNNKARLRESLVLCRDLMDMLQIVHNAETALDQQSPILVNRVQRFRHESMQFLMYKDWQAFESITEP